MSLTKIGSIGINTGIAFAGVTTITTLNGSDAVLSVGGTVNFVSDVSIGGTVSIAGTLTYEDVTNVDAVGLITARDGIVVGSGITLSVDGDIFATGVVTATSFSGSGALLTGVASTENIRTNTNATFLQNVSIVGTSTVTGNVVPSSDSATDIGTNSVRFQNAYVDTYYGDGSNLTGISAGVSLSNGSDNRVVTATGAAAITGESELTFDSSTLNLVAASGEARILVIGGEGEDARITLSADDGDDHIDQYNIESRASDNSFRIDQFSGGSRVDRLSIATEASDGDVTIHTGNLVIGTAGKGISFINAADTASGETVSSSVLDDYEEGTFTPTARGNNTNSSPVIEGSGKYTKIGNVVQIQLAFANENGSYLPGGEYIQIHGLPFTFNGEHFIPYGFNYKIVYNGDRQYLFYSPSGNTRLDGYINVSDSPYTPWGTDQWDNTQWYHSNSFSYLTS
tara:strand:+ start:271 stop:1635 length:1365 start_codon:yes stop_codon:yes gene_type:complete